MQLIDIMDKNKNEKQHQSLRMAHLFCIKLVEVSHAILWKEVVLLHTNIHYFVTSKVVNSPWYFELEHIK